MQLLELSVLGFGKFKNVSLKFGPGANLIYGRNEAGKSTLHSFLRAMLFGLSRRPEAHQRESAYERFAPWDEDAAYGGSLRFSYNGRVYRIERDFEKAADDLHIVEELTVLSGKNGGLTEKGTNQPGAAKHAEFGRTMGAAGTECEVSNPQALLSEALCGLTESGYIGTISIGQLKAASDKGMAAELRRYIGNLSTTGSADLDAAAAVRYLEQKKQAYAGRLQPDAAKQYARAVSSIKNLEAELSAPENENRLNLYQSRMEAANSELAEVSDRLRAAGERLEKARTVLSENQFTDEASVESCLHETEEVYAGCKKVREALSCKWKPAAAALLLAAGAAAVLFALSPSLYAGYLPFAVPQMFFPVLGSIFILLGLLISFHIQRNRKLLRGMEELLSGRFRTQTGNEAVSDETMSLYKERMEGFKKLCAVVREEQRERDRLSAELARLSAEQTDCGKQLEAQRKIQSWVEQKLQELNLCKNQAEEYRRITEENRRLKEEIDAVGIAQETLQRLGTEIKASIGTYLNREAGQLIDGITGGVYKSMDVGPDLSVRLNTRERMIPLQNVSAGTMDQIYLALRLAAVRLIEGRKDVLPLLFDDSFVLYDDDRLSHALSFILSHYSGQILIFTCQHREEKLLSEKGTPYNMICLGEKTTRFSLMNKL